MIILKKLEWDNCFSYGKQNSLDLNNSTLTQLVGTNGTGKSSLPLIIEEVLYNKNSKAMNLDFDMLMCRKLESRYLVNAFNT